MKHITGTRAGQSYRIDITYGSSPIPELDQIYVSRVDCWINSQIVPNATVMGNYHLRPKPIKEDFIVRSIEEYIDRLQEGRQSSG